MFAGYQQNLLQASIMGLHFKREIVMRTYFSKVQAGLWKPLMTPANLLLGD